MSLFPNIGPESYREEHRGILKKMEDFYAESITINQAFWGEADTDTRFEAGDQTLWSDIYGNISPNRRRQFNFNRIRRVINMVSGHQRRNRMSTIVTPIDNGDAETADQFTKIMMWANGNDGVLETISESFHGALVTGLNLLHVWMDYRTDPVSGNIRVDNCDYNSFIIDPYFKKQDLSDCNGLWKRTFLTPRQAISLLPDSKEEILALQPTDSKDGKFEFMPESYQYARSRLLTYDEFYYRDYRTQRMLIDSQTGESLEWRGKDEDALREYLSLYPQITVVDQEVPTVRVAIVVQGRVLYDGPNPLGIDKYPFVPVLGYYNPQLPYYPLRIQGMVRGLRDAQFLYNRRKVIELDILESQVNSGIKYKENALVNPKDAFLTGQGRGIAIKHNANMTDVEQIIPPQVPPSMIQLSEILGREIQEISGVNEELLGSAIDDKAGVLAMLRQGAGLTTLQTLFDQLNRSQKLLGNIMIDLIQANFAPGKVARILEKDPSPQFYNKAFGRYDAVVEEGLNTATQRQMQFAQLIQLRELGIPIPDDALLEASTVQNKKDLVAAVGKRIQQQAQAQNMQMQAMVEEKKARTDLAHSRAMADRGLGIERMSRVQENQALAVERRAEAQKDRYAGILNLAKALNELEDVEINQIARLLELSDFVREKENRMEKRAEEPIQESVPGPASSRGTLAGLMNQINTGEQQEPPPGS